MWKSRPAQERTCEADWMCVLACSQLKKDLNRLPQGTDAGGYGIFGNKNIVLFPFRGVMSATFRSVCRWNLHSASI